ncbi:MAG: hypothetical protein CMH83_12500 [Nocardioides sp.]|nr:hypothetical protein [Nocardioides sp.]
MSTSRDDAGFRSLADQLRAWSDDRLARLLAARLDLTTPAPHDVGHLASRAAVRASISRALDTLTLLELSVLDALVVAGQTTAEDVRTIVHAEPAAVDAALDRLEDLALAWHAVAGLRPLTGVADAMGTGPGVSGLQPRSPEPPPADLVEQRVAELSPRARAMLEHVVSEGGEATTAGSRHTLLPEEASTPAEELLARRLLVPRGSGSRVHAPGEVGLALRGGRTTYDAVDAVPEVATAERGARLVDSAASGAAFEAVRHVELLLELWGTDPPGVLRSGGLGVRDLKAAATLLQVDEPVAALLVEVASAAGLLGSRADAEGDPVWVPTDAFDAWTDAPPAERWLRLVRAWLDMPRLPALVGSRDQSGKGLNPLVPELGSPWIVETRHDVLEALSRLPAGEVLAAGTGLPSLVDHVAWHRPRRPASRADHVAWTVREAGLLGVLGLDGAPAATRALLAGDDAVAVLAPLLPEPVDHVLVQADLTAVAPGPLEAGLARRLALVADVESRGGATTYRFSSSSVRRALDVGWSGAEVHAFLASVSRTPVPQPLTYLVDDAVRTYGTVRIGAAEAFLRADDETALSELLHHPRAGSLGLRRIAPTVLVSTVPVDVLLDRLRELGSAPVLEAADGTVQVVRPDALRARTPRERRPLGAAAASDTARVAQVVTAVRAGDRAATSRPSAASASSSGGPALTPSGALTALREAVETGTTVVIGYVDAHGTVADRMVDPLGVADGSLRAHDHRSDDERSFAVHRIRSVRVVEG